MPLLMRIFPGLKPWDLDRLTIRELQTLRDFALALTAKEGADNGV